MEIQEDFSLTHADLVADRIFLIFFRKVVRTSRFSSLPVLDSDVKGPSKMSSTAMK